MNIFFKIDDEGNILGITTNSGNIPYNPNIKIDTHFVKNGEFVKYTEDQFFRKKNSPGFTFKWSNNLMDWVDQRAPDEIHNNNMEDIRKKRNQLLQSSDWTQLPDVPITTKEAWAVYRQALRDVTLQPDPFNITWPVPPQET